MALFCYLQFGFKPVFQLMAGGKISGFGVAISPHRDHVMKFVRIDTVWTILLRITFSHFLLPISDGLNRHALVI